MKIEDNFLKQEEFNKLHSDIMSPTFPVLSWFFKDVIDFEDDVDKFQFGHVFYENFNPTSDNIQMMHPILRILDPLSILKIKTNLLTRTLNIVENRFHTDMGGISEEKLKQWTTSIFYINTNNGYTKFENGEKVESVANRMVTFSTNLKHTGTSCTDERTRVVINFNYFK